MPWDNPFEPCACPRGCVCGGFMRSYAMAYKRVLQVARPYLVFEWGPGHNSRLAVKAGARVFAVEHQEKFVPKDLPAIKFSCRVVPLESDDYVRISPYEHADLFFVDGRRRADCIRAVRSRCLDRAVLCLHDAQRSRYHEALKSFPYVKFLERGFAVASKTDYVISRLTRSKPKKKVEVPT